MQATDEWCGVWRARVVLIDTAPTAGAADHQSLAEADGLGRAYSSWWSLDRPEAIEQGHDLGVVVL